MRRHILTEFSGGFSRAIREDMLPDNVCQSAVNVEVNRNGLIERRNEFEISSNMPNFLGEIVDSYLWNSFFRLNGSNKDHVIIVLKRLVPPNHPSLYDVFLWVEGIPILQTDVITFLRKPSIAVTDRKVYILGSKDIVSGEQPCDDDFLHFMEIDKDEKLVHGIYDVPQPKGEITQISKLIQGANSGRTTGLRYGALLQYCYTLVDKEGKESLPSRIQSQYSRQFLLSTDYWLLRSVTLEFDEDKIELKKQGIENVNIYRRYALYSESYEGMSPFTLVGIVQIEDIECGFNDNSTQNVIQLKETGYKIAGEEVVYLDNTLFVSNGVKPIEFGIRGELIQEIRINNIGGKGWVNKVLTIEIKEGDVLFNILSNDTERKKHVIIDFDTRTPLMSSVMTQANSEILTLVVQIPYIYPNAVYSLYVLNATTRPPRPRCPWLDWMMIQEAVEVDHGEENHE